MTLQELYDMLRYPGLGSAAMTPGAAAVPPPSPAMPSLGATAQGRTDLPPESPYPGEGKFLRDQLVPRQPLPPPNSVGKNNTVGEPFIRAPIVEPLPMSDPYDLVNKDPFVQSLLKLLGY